MDPSEEVFHDGLECLGPVCFVQERLNSTELFFNVGFEARQTRLLATARVEVGRDRLMPDSARLWGFLSLISGCSRRYPSTESCVL